MSVFRATSILGILLLAFTGGLALFIVTPTLTGTPLPSAYLTTSPDALASVWFWYFCWLGFTALMFTSSVALIAKLDERVHYKSANNVMKMSAVFGPLSLSSLAFIIPNAASEITFSKLSSEVAANPVSIAIVSLSPILIVASLVLCITGFWLKRAAS